MTQPSQKARQESFGKERIAYKVNCCFKNVLDNKRMVDHSSFEMQEVPFQELVPGDLFVLKENTGKFVQNGKVYKALSSPSYNEVYGTEMLDCEETNYPVILELVEQADTLKRLGRTPTEIELEVFTRSKSWNV